MLALEFGAFSVLIEAVNLIIELNNLQADSSFGKVPRP